jgi:hypothetical protein
VIATGKRRERLRPQQAMGIGNRTNGSHHARPEYKRSRAASPVLWDQPRTNCRQSIPRQYQDGARHQQLNDLVNFLTRLAATVFRQSIVTKVPYIDDNDDNVFMLKMQLELLGHFERSRPQGGTGSRQPQPPTRRQCPRASTAVNPADVMRSHRQSSAPTNNWGQATAVLIGCTISRSGREDQDRRRRLLFGEGTNASAGLRYTSLQSKLAERRVEPCRSLSSSWPLRHGSRF